MLPIIANLGFVQKTKRTRFRQFTIVTLLLNLIGPTNAQGETLPALRESAPVNFDQMWQGFDARSEPLEVEILKQWTEAGVELRVVRFRIGIFKGKLAKLAAIYGYPQTSGAGGKKHPGLVQIDGGGQYADYRACLANAKRGYATISIAWAGRINASQYRVSPDEVKRFWEGKSDSPDYRLTTDWGAVDAYHAPSRNTGNQFPSVRPAAWTLDTIESPRNSGWFLCAIAARRALTFLEQQPEVDAERLGIYGHSMGGKLTVLASVDPRVRAAAPSCGGISDRGNQSEIFHRTLGDQVSLKRISCPIIFLSPANDFHGRIGDLPKAINEISSNEWRVTCSPHHNHQDTPEYEAATLLWFDQHLKGTFTFPQTPKTELLIDTKDGVPIVRIHPDPTQSAIEVDVYYTQQGNENERAQDREQVMHRFWHHAPARRHPDVWTARLPIGSIDRPLWVYANVRYSLDVPVTGAGYYYATFKADTFNVSSLLTIRSPEQLKRADVRATLQPTNLIEDFVGSWEKQWFSYQPQDWARTTHKLNTELWRAGPNSLLGLTVESVEPNKILVVLDASVAEIEVAGGDKPHTFLLRPNDFKNYEGESLREWRGVRRLKLGSVERLRPTGHAAGKSRRVGAQWSGPAPRFRQLYWHVNQDANE